MCSSFFSSRYSDLYAHDEYLCNFYYDGSDDEYEVDIDWGDNEVTRENAMLLVELMYQAEMKKWLTP